MFRTHYSAFARSGWITSDGKDLEASYDPARSRLTLVERSEFFQHSESNDGNDWSKQRLAIQHEDDEWFLRLRERKEWTYRWDGARLRYLRGRELIDCGDYGYLAGDLAAHYQIDRARLVALNPGRDVRTVWKGLVLLRDRIPRYAPDPDDGLCGDKPCRDDED